MRDLAGSGEAAAAQQPLSRLLDPSAINLGANAADWRAAVRLAGDALVASGATAPAYTDAMVATVEELGPYIVLAPGIALAHARPSAAVHRAGMSLVTLAAPVPFGNPRNDPVTLVIGLAAPDEEGHVAALATLAEFLADAGRQAALLRSTSPGEALRLIAAFERTQQEVAS
jgi:PTS system ascorbate-specific IIA component